MTNKLNELIELLSLRKEVHKLLHTSYHKKNPYLSNYKDNGVQNREEYRYDTWIKLRLMIMMKIIIMKKKIHSVCNK